MSPWRSFGFTGAALLLACIKANPAFDPDASASASGSAGPSSAASSGPDLPPTTTATTTSGVSDSDATSLPTSLPTTTITTATTAELTTAVHCGLLNEPCGDSNCCTGCGLCMAGTCMADPSVCGPCGVCGDDSQCAPQPMSTPCKLADDPCAGKIWGLDNGICFANAPSDGLCDGGDQCLPQACTQGDKLVGCDAACIIDPANCAADMPVAQVDANLLCAQNGPTPQCSAECVAGDPSDYILERSCQQGLCTDLKSTSCVSYVCKSPDKCPESCMSEADCKPDKSCSDNKCD